MAPPTFLGYSGPPIHVASCRDHRHTIGQNPVQSHSQSLGGYPPPIHRWRCSMQGFIKTLISGNSGVHCVRIFMLEGFTQLPKVSDLV